MKYFMIVKVISITFTIITLNYWVSKVTLLSLKLTTTL